MQKIADFLEGFKKIGAKQFLVREAFLKACKNQLGVDIPLKEVKWKEGTLFLSTSIHPTIKSAILIKKARLLEEVIKETGTPVTDIR